MLKEAITMHKIRSALYILVLMGILVAVGFIVTNREGALTGATVVNTVACYENSDCNDHIDPTKDICLNPGTTQSLCVNRPEK